MADEVTDVSEVAADTEALVADTKTEVVAVETEANGVFTAIRDFKASFGHQILTFVKDEEIEARVGSALRALGAPIKFAEAEIEKAVKAVKAKV